MPYVDLAGLSRFAEKSKDFASSACAGPDMANWQRTAAAGAVSFLPVPEMPLDPVVNFLFTESGPASGTKGPDNPSTITGVTQAKVTRCGKNFLDVNATFATGNLSAAINIDGSIRISGTTTAWNYVYFSQGNDLSNKKLPNYIQKGKTYTFSLTTSFENCSFGVYISNSLSSWSSQYTVSPNSSVTVTVGSDAVRAMFRLQVPSGYTTNFDAYIQIEEGDTATSFEKAVPTDYTIPLGGTYYGGSVDLSTGVMTVTHFCTNVSTFYQFTEAKTDCILVRFRCDYYSKESSDLVSYVCDLFPSSRDTGDFEHVRQNNDSAISATLYLDKSRLDLSGAADPSSPTDAEWLAAANAWVAEHPFKFVSMLKNPYTVQLTSTQILSLSQPDSYTPRINTIYSDQISVQVGYPKSPQASQTELTNAIVSLGGNV